MRSTAGLLGVILGTGCAVTPVQPPEMIICEAPGYRSLVGGNIAALTLPAGLEVRIIQPGDAITQDFRAERLNFVVDLGGTITRVYCG